MPGPEKSSTEEAEGTTGSPGAAPGPAKVVKKVKKIKKTVAGAPAAPAAPQAAMAPAPDAQAPFVPVAPATPSASTDRQPALERIGAAPPPGDLPRAAPPSPRPGPIKEAYAVEPARQPAAQRLPEAPAAPAQPALPPPPPPGFAAREPARPATAPPSEERSMVESRISSIDIDKLTDELEKDILSSLHSEMGDLMASKPAPSPRERTEVRDDHTKAANAPPAPVAAPPAPPAARTAENLPQARAMESEQRERRVAHRLGREFDKLPVNMRNELIRTLARTDDIKVREDVVIAIASNFDKLPLEVRSLLKALASDLESGVREEVAFELNRNFKKITADFRNELITLLAKDVDIKVREDIVSAIASHYDEHPPEVRELLKVLSSDKRSSVRDQVAHELQSNKDRIPEGLHAEMATLMEKAAADESRGKE